ncbi:hypothetical protein [Sedimentitalea nanhaiensis]|uniref:Uncharacterized protein n=1 Tax=Sedimentitalea nanhaiensis TaxID=999627 RepID=A0A1I7E415_9RHOB|nr:hypothetical protein [Sedimentitalea nanhaiensis]SFU18672.1 hypothetical protein SAMN05216236_14335 [Sedimentitalea nanhaiensis]
MNAPIEPQEHRVDPSRLASGTWCHTRNRQIGEGDIAASYSADKIAQGKIRKPFFWKNCLWVCTGTNSKSAEAYRLVPERFFDGELTTYNEVAMLPFEQRIKPEGFYHGMRVRHGKQDCVLVGPKALLLPKEESETLKQADLFDAL